MKLGDVVTYTPSPEESLTGEEDVPAIVSKVVPAATADDGTSTPETVTLTVFGVHMGVFQVTQVNEDTAPPKPAVTDDEPLNTAFG
jgi:hypothetical protein